MTSKTSYGNQQNKDISKHSVLLRDYMETIGLTDTLPKDNLDSILMGLFGEVGSIMTAVKKQLREKAAYAGYQQAVEEEFGDTLWYFTALCQRLGIGIDIIFSNAVNQNTYSKTIATSDLSNGPIAHISSANELPVLEKTLLNLGQAAAALHGIQNSDEQAHDFLHTFSDCYLQALQAAGVNFSKTVRMNIEKTRGRFLDPELSSLPTFDSNFPEQEKLPSHFEIKITERENKQCYLQWNGVFIGDPLTDNILDPDGYRFHDAFHLAYAAILHWSPAFRALIKQKRKSDPQVDEAEDGGRAIVIEEGLSAWIFSCAKHLNFFEGHSSISFDMLKTVQQFVQGYEVEECPLKLWERAILEGYEVFRQVRNNNGGIVVGDRETRTIRHQAK